MNPADALAGRHLDLEDLFTDLESARRFVDSMPSADVCVSLMTAAHRNPETKWTGNDMFDIDALSVAVPYCDVVVTERHARHVLTVSGAHLMADGQARESIRKSVTALAMGLDFVGLAPNPARDPVQVKLPLAEPD